MSKTVRNIVRLVILVVLVGLLAAGVLWSVARSGDAVCREVRVEISNRDSSTYVTAEGILAELKDNAMSLKGKPMRSIDTDSVERILEKSAYLEGVECLKRVEHGQGVVEIRVRQIVPVMRVFEDGKSYYVNRDGKKMPASTTYHTDVPVVKGRFYATFTPQKMIPLIEYVERDSLLKALVSMYTFKDSTNIIVVPTISGHVVNIGDVNNYEAKFRKLLLFYQKVMPVKGWMTYDTVSGKSDYQVVATRRTKAVKEVIDWNEDDDEPAPDMEMLQDGSVADSTAHN